MKLFLILQLLFNFHNHILNDFIDNIPVYKYREMKEIRYIYFYDFANFDIDNIEIYAGSQKITFDYELTNYYKIDLNNYYPLSCLIIYNNQDNTSFSVKYNDEDNFNAKSFAYLDVTGYKNLITIDDLIIDEPKWSNIIYSHKKLIENKILIEVN